MSTTAATPMTNPLSPPTTPANAQSASNAIIPGSPIHPRRLSDGRRSSTRGTLRARVGPRAPFASVPPPSYPHLGGAPQNAPPRWCGAVSSAGSPRTGLGLALRGLEATCASGHSTPSPTRSKLFSAARYRPVIAAPNKPRPPPERGCRHSPVMGDTGLELATGIPPRADDASGRPARQDLSNRTTQVAP
jgi:hypothetical protein